MKCYRCNSSGWILEDKPRWISSPEPSDPPSKGKWSNETYTFAKRCGCSGRPNEGIRSDQRPSAPERAPMAVSEEPAKPSEPTEKPKPRMRDKWQGRIDKRADLPEDWF